MPKRTLSLTLRPYRAGDSTVPFRPEDEAECFAAGGHSCRESIEESLEWGEVTVAADTATDTPVVFFGCPGYLCGGGHPWMLATPALPAHARAFHHLAAEVLQGWLTQYARLSNLVDSRNALHIRWLRRLGFQFPGDVVMNGPVPFLYFYRTRNVLPASLCGSLGSP